MDGGEHTVLLRAHERASLWINISMRRHERRSGEQTEQIQLFINNYHWYFHFHLYIHYCHSNKFIITSSLSTIPSTHPSTQRLSSLCTSPLLSSSSTWSRDVPRTSLSCAVSPSSALVSTSNPISFSAPLTATFEPLLVPTLNSRLRADATWGDCCCTCMSR